VHEPQRERKATTSLLQAFEILGAIPALEGLVDAGAALVSLLLGANGGPQDATGKAHAHRVPHSWMVRRRFRCCVTASVIVF
jgi:hypothetical protein